MNPKTAPMVTFVCLTYGRAALQPAVLNEAVFWMLNQEWPEDKLEVLIINDVPNQTVTCKHPRVRVENWHERMADLGTKMDVGRKLAHGRYCLVNDDDDVSLPWRVRTSVARLHMTGYDYWAPRLWLYEEKGSLPRVDGNGYSYNCSAWSSWKMRHPVAIKGHDAAAAVWAAENLQCHPDPIKDPREVGFVYRWGFSHAHLSGFGERAEQAFHTMPTGPAGVYEIIPAMDRDYTQIHRLVVGGPPP